MNAPLEIDVILLPSRYLREQYKKIIPTMMWLHHVTNSLVRLPSPVNAPLAIDVIWLTPKSLHVQYANTHAACDSASLHTI